MQRISILLLFIGIGASHAQIKSQVFIDGQVHETKDFEDSLKISNYIQQYQIKSVDQGYFFAGLDSVSGAIQEDLRIYLHKGERSKLKLSNYKGRRVTRYLGGRLSRYTNHGYPFATLSLDSLQRDKDEFTAELKVSIGPEILYDSSYFFSPIKTNHSYVYKLLDIVPGDQFSERAYAQIARKVERSVFFRLQRPTDLAFKDEKAKVFLDIKEEASNSFQGVLGLQQNSNQNSTVVGSIILDIQNLFRSGKQLRFAWERFSTESQQLEIFYKHPFILDSKLSPSFTFDLLKQDTTFLTRRLGFGVHTYIAPRVELLVAYEQTQGTLLSTDIEALEQSGLSGFTRPLYSLQITKGDLLRLGRLANANMWSLSIAGGRKSIDRNLDVPDSYYDSLSSSSNFYRLEGAVAYQARVFKRQAFFHHATFGFIDNDQILQNELFRVGGLTTLRGFNEKEFFVEQYALSRAEFRSYFEAGSYAYVFYDQLIYRRSEFNDAPLGIGLGFALATSAGQFSFALALGDSKNQSLSFATMKAHFGYVSRF